MDIKSAMGGYLKTLTDPIQNAYADIGSDGKYFCNPDELAKRVETEGYFNLVDRMNNAYSGWLKDNPGATLDDKADYLIRPGLEGLGKMAECLDVYHKIDPDSVKMLSDPIQEVLALYPERVSEVAPTLVKHATVPEFGDMMNSLIGSASSYLAIGQEKAAETSAATGDIGLIFGLGVGLATVGIAALKKYGKGNLFK